MLKVINDTLSNDDSFQTNIDLERFDVIVDCTGENSVLDILQSTNFKKPHIIASVSVGLGAKRLYITLMNGNTFNFNAFYDLVSPYLQAEKTYMMITIYQGMELVAGIRLFLEEVMIFGLLRQLPQK